MGKLLDLYESQRVTEAKNANVDAEAERVNQAHEIGADIDQLASKLQRHLKPHTVDATRVTVSDGADSEITIDVIEPNLANPGTCFRVAGSQGELAEYNEEELLSFLVDWINAQPRAA
ncbi:hypothetical protein XI02_42230 [Bradyrhizobium sp. CCBAU 21365]|uniref:hypothetical protein n=1 Tax=Bradyrhizobium sp. CCBAU 21365 TaxID=1325083 RepID=UPI00188AB2AF|nr:hypothetical protein [Bradyrhizobium sp. CCBAU 21365]QOZ20835.1 hypothetical protein XI02_42230 [Bradyrhizobium sp. CCBAU 21365]